MEDFREGLKALLDREALCPNCARARKAAEEYDPTTDPQFPHQSFVALPKTGSTRPHVCITHQRQRKFVFY